MYDKRGAVNLQYFETEGNGWTLVMFSVAPNLSRQNHFTRWWNTFHCCCLHINKTRGNICRHQWTIPSLLHQHFWMWSVFNPSVNKRYKMSAVERAIMERSISDCNAVEAERISSMRMCVSQLLSGILQFT